MRQARKPTERKSRDELVREVRRPVHANQKDMKIDWEHKLAKLWPVPGRVQ